MVQIEEEKIAELMFDIWHNSNDLKNPVMAGEYIAKKLKEALIIDDVVERSEQLKAFINFAEWYKEEYNQHIPLGAIKEYTKSL